MSKSFADVISELPEEERKAYYAELSPKEQEDLFYYWPFWARPEQIEPGTKGAINRSTGWMTWVPLAGRGWGKTRVGAEFIRANVCGSTPLSGGKYGRISLVAETAADARDVMVESDSGILGVHPKDYRPIYEPSKRRLTWPNGATATLFNATEPDQLRGPQFDIAWLDELAKWKYGVECWAMLQFGLRGGTFPKQIVTTTPRPIPLLKEIMEDPMTVVTRHSTFENASNLAPVTLKNLQRRYGGTRLGRQELEAEVLDDVPGALWTRGNLDDNRRQEDTLPEMQRIVVGVDPAITVPDPDSDHATSETGIVVCGLGVDGRGYILDDHSGYYSPDGWARQAVAAYDVRDADAVIAEINQGGDMVERTLRSARSSLNIIKVRAARGKVTRAEPIAALFEQGRACMVGNHNKLEDQMMLFTAEGIVGQGGSDRVDALVWAMTSLFDKIVKSGRRRIKPVLLGINDGYDARAW